MSNVNTDALDPALLVPDRQAGAAGPGFSLEIGNILAGSVLTSGVVVGPGTYNSGAALDDLEPGEAGADVTGSNTADDVFTGFGRAVEETGANNTESRTSADTSAVNGTSSSTIISGGKIQADVVEAADLLEIGNPSNFLGFGDLAVGGFSFLEGGVDIGGNAFTVNSTNATIFGPLNISGGLLELAAEAAAQAAAGDLVLNPGQPFAETRADGDLAATGSKPFDIPYPGKPGWRIRYYAMEGPEVCNFHRFRVQAQQSGEKVQVALAEHWPLVNDTEQVCAFPLGHFGRAYGEIENGALNVTCEQPGEYGVWVTARRADDNVRRREVEYYAPRKDQ